MNIQFKMSITWLLVSILLLLCWKGSVQSDFWDTLSVDESPKTTWLYRAWILASWATIGFFLAGVWVS
jgi:hypothetical protein